MATLGTGGALGKVQNQMPKTRNAEVNRKIKQIASMAESNTPATENGGRLRNGLLYGDIRIGGVRQLTWQWEGLLWTLFVSWEAGRSWKRICWRLG